MSTLLVTGSTAVEIAESIEQLIRDREIVTGHLLPAVRSLAAQLDVSPNTVGAAYKLLRDAQWVVTDGRRGTRVAAEQASAIARHALPEHLRDLASGNVDARLLPRLDAQEWAGMPGDTGYDIQANEPQLLDLAARWLHSQHLPSQDIGVFQGAMDCMEKALRTHCRPGNRVLVESPCWPPVLALLASLRLKPVTLLSDNHGACVPSEQALQNAAAVILTPRAQNPTGRTFSESRWQTWANALQEAPGTLLILDDHWGPLSHATPPQAMAMPARWVHITSASKFLGPDLRLSVVTGAPQVLAAMQRLQALASRWVSLLVQRLAARLWQQALDQGLLRHAAESYAQRRHALIDALGRHGVQCEQGGEGMHVWLPVADEASAVQALASYGWGVQPGTPFSPGGSAAVRVSTANLESADIEALARDIALSLRLSRRPVY